MSAESPSGSLDVSQQRQHRRHSTSHARRASGMPTGTSARAAANPSIFDVHVDGDNGGIEMKGACDGLYSALGLREKYKSIDKGQSEGVERLAPPIGIHVSEGVLHFTHQVTQIVPWEQYYADVQELLATVANPLTASACRYRLTVLEEKYNLFQLNNAAIEENADKYRRGGGVFSNIPKVDTSVHLQTSMHSLGLLHYIQDTHEHHSGEIVRLHGDKKEPRTLAQAFEELYLQESQHLTVEGLGLHLSNEGSFIGIWDILDPEINSAGRSAAEVLQLFLRRKTLNDGRYLSEIAHRTLDRGGDRRNTVICTELTVEVTGYEEDEWNSLAQWHVDHNLTGVPTNKWIVAIVRNNKKRSSVSELFDFHQKHIDNIFLPLFMATLAPEDPKNAALAEFLRHVGGFVLTSDETVRESPFPKSPFPPQEVSWYDNPPDLWFTYYLWANICSLNAFRQRKGLNTFVFRSRAGDTLDSLIYSYLLCDSVTDGSGLAEQPVLQMLYGINDVGIAMSPLRANATVTPYMENPFPTFFRRGLRVTLCTEDPLLVHHSKDALLEEYGTASKLYRMSGVDMCEVARNSILMSTFSDDIKRNWLGNTYSAGYTGNVPELTNIPTARLKFRSEVWESERTLVSSQHHKREVQNVDLPAKIPHMVFDRHVGHYPRIGFSGPLQKDQQHISVATHLYECLRKRRQYHNLFEDTVLGQQHHHVNIEHAFKKSDFLETEWQYKTVDGVVVPHGKRILPRQAEGMRRFDDFRQDMQAIKAVTANLHVKGFADQRLKLLEHKYRLHIAVNHSVEAGSTEEKASQNRDFYQATKVDTNVRMESGMTARQLLNFIVTKANNNADDIVKQVAGREPQTLRQLLRELDIDTDHLAVDDLNVQVDTALGLGSQQFTPEGRDALLTLLLKTDNQMKGRYFAELTKLTFDNFKRDQFTFAENRLPIYGASVKEWVRLSDWFDNHGMACQNNQWMVQFPRIYGYLRRQGKVKNFSEYLENIFNPLWDISLHPRSNPRLFHFVNHISGFDCVEDEQQPDQPLSMTTVKPQEWNFDYDPPYSYYLYYIWANIYSLNDFRGSKRNFSTFTFRPSCGESGSTDHLIAGFLLGNAINYGIRLKDDAVLQYLYYLSQIGVAVCPLSNNTKVLDYLENPFPLFFSRGLNVSLSTDGPLQFHHTQEPLIEEYSIASKVWKLSSNDMCEIARNSVKLSGFEHEFKKDRLGTYYSMSSSQSNDATRTHLSGIRVAYRFETYHTEMALLDHVAGTSFPRAMLTLEEEEKLVSAIQEQERRDQDSRRHGEIINVQQDEGEFNTLASKRTLMQTQLDNLSQSLGNLHTQNKELTERLQSEVLRDQQAQQLRKVASSSDERISLASTGSQLMLEHTGSMDSSGQLHHTGKKKLRGTRTMSADSADLAPHEKPSSSSSSTRDEDDSSSFSDDELETVENDGMPGHLSTAALTGGRDSAAGGGFVFPMSPHGKTPEEIEAARRASMVDAQETMWSPRVGKESRTSFVASPAGSDQPPPQKQKQQLDEAAAPGTELAQITKRLAQSAGKQRSSTSGATPKGKPPLLPAVGDNGHKAPAPPTRPLTGGAVAK